MSGWPTGSQWHAQWTAQPSHSQARVASASQRGQGQHNDAETTHGDRARPANQPENMLCMNFKASNSLNRLTQHSNQRCYTCEGI